MAYTTIDDPSAHFQTVIWTGNDSNPRTISHDGNSDMQPDWLWHKVRNSASSHMVYDSSRGVGKRLHTDQNVAEATESAQGTITAFTSDGFTVDAGTSNDFYVNDSAQTYVSWGWKANGGTTSSNTDGTITSTVQANTEAGFNILTYTGTGSNATLGHGLGVVPKFVIYKRRSAVENWGAYHTSTGNTGCCFLNLTIAKSTASSYFNNTSPTSTTLSFGSNPAFNGNGSTHVAYCFAEKQGYSKFGSYVGNGSTNGPFVYTGFKPAFVLLKSSTAAESWELMDNKRLGYNGGTGELRANLTNAETTSNQFDLLSNGFKPRTTAGQWNTNNATYIYAAFAESPFVSSKGVPTTAR